MILFPHAKVNLSLYITGKREDGYHTIDTVFQPVSLCDRLEMEPTDAFSFACSRPELEKADNLAVRAYALMKQVSILPGEFAVRLDKKIPSEAGLGGGSADAAAVLEGLNELLQLGFVRPDLEEIGAELGADVPALLHHGPARGLGTGTKLRGLVSRSDLYFLIVKAPVSCPTAAMYRAWDEQGKEAYSPQEIRIRQKELEEALAQGDLVKIAARMHNDFEAVLPEEAAAAFRKIREQLRACGALKSLLCGSGSAVLGLFSSKKSRDGAFADLKADAPADWQIFSCEAIREEPPFCSVILAAGGSGSRFGGRNKLFAELEGKAVLAHSLRVFLSHPAVRQIVIPCREEDEEEIQAIVRQEKAELKASERQLDLPEIVLCWGGKERQESVRHALKLVKEPYVLIHDGARPFVKVQAVDDCLGALQDYPAVSVAIPSRDTVKLTNARDEVTETTERAHTWLIQTPQGFAAELLRRAHEEGKKISVTDDCTLMERAGYTVKLIEGDPSNIKITFPEDLPQR